MDVCTLFKGIAVIIDDEVFNNKAPHISGILSQFEKHHIPCIKYDTLPSNEEIKNLREISFVFLDWRLDPLVSDPEDTVHLPDELARELIEKNIEFIGHLWEVCFCPIFIFSNESVDTIIGELEKKKLYSQKRPSPIFVKAKGHVDTNDQLFDEIDGWLTRTPSMYILKEWEQEYRKSKNKLFREFQALSPEWPRIMWDTFGDDGTNKSHELGELIWRNLNTRMMPVQFVSDILAHGNGLIDKSELIRVLEGERFLKKECLHSDSIAPGDVFYKSNKYYVNVRAACDCIPDRSKNGSNLDDVNLYLLKGSKLKEKKLREAYNEFHGSMSETPANAILFPLNDGKGIDIRFKDIEIKPWSEMKAHRIGRILPPHITRIQQRYALYMHREGLPRIPKEAITDSLQ